MRLLLPSIFCLIIAFISCKPDRETVLYEELTPSEFRNRLNEMPVAYLPLGSLEYHGEHLPLGTDALHSKGFFIEMAHKTGGIVMPIVVLGPSWYTGEPVDSLIKIHCTPSPLTGSCYWIPDSVYNILLDNQFYLLSQTGFKIVVVHGHAPSVIYVERNKAEWEKKYSIHIVPYFIYRDNHDLNYTGHASVNETSLIMHYYPDRVKLESITSDTSVIPYGIQSKNPRGIASSRLGQEMETKHLLILHDSIQRIMAKGFR